MNSPTSPTTVVAFDSESRQRSMLIEIHPEIDSEASDSDVRDFERRMFNGNVSIGLLVTRGWTYVVRDQLTAMDFAGNTYEVSKLETAMLLRAAGLGPPKSNDAFGFQIVAWLNAVARTWNVSLPSEVIHLMVPEVVGNLASARFETEDGLSAFGDAA